MKHTPGPWHINEDQKDCGAGKLSIEAKDEYFIAQVDESVSQEANAKLIAAAPELLEALRELDECYCEAGNDLSKEDRHRHRMTLIKARAAIEKATGK